MSKTTRQLRCDELSKECILIRAMKRDLSTKDVILLQGKELQPSELFQSQTQCT
jgi:hypothetical protein